MKSELPKVLFPVCGRPMVHFVVEALQRAGVQRIIVVVGYRSDLVREELGAIAGIEFVEQTEQLGTGHAVQMAEEKLTGHEGPVFVVAGDSPLLQSESLQKLLTQYSQRPHAALLGTLLKDDPTGLGRIVRDEDGKFVGIVEHKDASDEQRAIREVNMSTYLFNNADLLRGLGMLSNDNSQGEYYITDVPGLLLEQGCLVEALPVLNQCEALSINTVDELSLVEAKMAELGYPLNA